MNQYTTMQNPYLYLYLDQHPKKNFPYPIDMVNYYMLTYCTKGGENMSPVSKAQAKYNSGYVKENIRQFMLKVNRKLDPEMVEWLENKENVQAYLKDLIRKDMESSKK